MSIDAFKATLKDRAFKNLFDTLPKNIIAEASSKFRKTEQSDSNRNSFLLNDAAIVKMAKYVTESDEISLEEIENIKERMLSSLDNVKGKGDHFNIRELKIDPKGKATEFVVENINFQTMQTMLNAGINKMSGAKKLVGSGFHRGHVVGLPTQLLSGIIERVEDNKNLVENENIGSASQKLSDSKRRRLLYVLNAYRNELHRQDIASTTTEYRASIEVLAEYTKSYDNYLVEMQIGVENTDAGNDVNSLVRELRSVVNPKKFVSANFDKLLNDTVNNTGVIGKLLSTQSSPSYLQLLGNKLVNILSSNNKLQTKVPKSRPVQVSSHTIKAKVSPTQQSQIKKAKQSVDAAIKELNKPSRLRSSTGQFLSLTSLQNLINSRLAEQIANNMGDGSSRRLLNFQTGRLAASAHVEGMSASREGMITAFYTYMKNPYATFSQGGRQQYPGSRDPKLLISKSIREIAAAKVGNRLRAVLV